VEQGLQTPLATVADHDPDSAAMAHLRIEAPRALGFDADRTPPSSERHVA